MKKSGLKAFLFGFIPGLGHMYLNKFKRGFIYPISMVMILALFIFIAAVNNETEIILAGAVICLIIWCVSGIDLIITIISRSEQSAGSEPYTDPSNSPGHTSSGSSAAIALAFIPGLGHMHMGLMMRGLSFLIGFFGLMTMIFFVFAFTNEGGFLVFLGVLPVLWIYNLFDATQLFRRRNSGETLQDRTIFEELTQLREQGKKSKIIAMFLALLPGAGHMYLGLQRRGLQLMIAFLLSIYILDVLHLSLFLFLIPILWCFSFFDALQQVGRYEQGDAQDVPIVDWLLNHQRWVGYGLLALGAFYIVDHVAFPLLYEYFPRLRLRYWYEQYFQTTLVSLVLILGGLKLLSGSKKRGKRSEQSDQAKLVDQTENGSEAE
jgi:hypothetical protein